MYNIILECWTIAGKMRLASRTYCANSTNSQTVANHGGSQHSLMRGMTMKAKSSDTEKGINSRHGTA
jgi:hypothetical protein